MTGTTFPERLKNLRKITQKLTLEKFGDRIGVSKDVVANLEYGRVEPSEIVIRAICREFGVDYDWLKYGDGEMFASEEDEVLAALDDLMTSEEHEETRALIKALAGMTEDELTIIDRVIAKMKKELGG